MSQESQAPLLMMMMEAVRTSETSVDNHFTRQYNPEDSSERNLVCYTDGNKTSTRFLLHSVLIVQYLSIVTAKVSLSVRVMI
jgi:hypothetical protein